MIGSMGADVEVKYQVFVSSTYSDLEDERRSVIESILNLGHIPVGMEAFQASDDEQWTYIKRRIDDSDYYVLIVAERYGSELDGKSYTQMEYEYAVEKEIPVMAFLLDNEERKKWPRDKVEFEKQDKITNFRRLCESRRLVKYWRNKDDLAGKVAMALGELIRQKPRIGWVRGDKLPSKDVFQELAHLSEERRSLQEKIKQLSQESEIVVPAEYNWKMDKLNGIILYKMLGWEIDDRPITLLEMLMNADTVLASGPEQYELAEHFGAIGYFLENPELESVVAQYILLGLVGIERREVHRRGVVTIYHLTDQGKQLLMYARVLQERAAAQL